MTQARILVVDDEAVNAYLSFRNIEKVTIIGVSEANTRYLIDTEAGVRFIVEKQNSHTPRTAPSATRGDNVRLRFQRDHAMAIPGSEPTQSRDAA